MKRFRHPLRAPSNRIILADLLDLSDVDGISIVKPTQPSRDGPLNQLVSLISGTRRVTILDMGVPNQIVVTACRLDEEARTYKDCGALTYFFMDCFQRESHKTSLRSRLVQYALTN